MTRSHVIWTSICDHFLIMHEITYNHTRTAMHAPGTNYLINNTTVHLVLQLKQQTGTQ